MFKFKKLFSVFLIILILSFNFCYASAVDKTTLETDFNTWASGKTFGTIHYNSTLKEKVENYMSTNYSGQNYVYYFYGYQGSYGGTYYIDCYVGNNIVIDSYTSDNNNFNFIFSDLVSNFVLRYKTSTDQLGVYYQPSSLGSFGINANSTIEGDNTLQSTLFNYSSMTDSSLPTPTPTPDFSISLLLSSISDGINDFGVFLGIILNNGFFKALILILVCLLIILVAVRILLKFRIGVKNEKKDI